MHKWKAGKLHSGGKKGPVVKDQAQAVAIMLSEKRAAKKGKKEYQAKAKGGTIGPSSEVMGKGRSRIAFTAEGRKRAQSSPIPRIGTPAVAPIDEAATEPMPIHNIKKPRGLF